MFVGGRERACVQNSFLDHVMWLRRAVLAARADFHVAGDTMQALVRLGSREVWRLLTRGS